MRSAFLTLRRIGTKNDGISGFDSHIRPALRSWQHPAIIHDDVTHRLNPDISIIDSSDLFGGLFGDSTLSMEH